MTTLRRFRYALSKSPLRVPFVLLRHRGLDVRDVFFGSYPRSGSTWLRFLLFETLSGQSSEFGKVNTSIPNVGDHRKAPRLLPGGGRLIKTHEPYRNSYEKALYLVRDPRDVVLSEFAYHQALGVVGDEFDRYLLSFLRKTVSPFGSWQYNVQTWLQAKMPQGRNIVVIKFEDLRGNTAATLAHILEFLNVSRDSEAIQRAVDNNSVEKMREKENRSPQRVSQKGRFIRTGTAGGWRQRLTDRQIELIESYTHELLASLGYPADGAFDSKLQQQLTPVTKP